MDNLTLNYTVIFDTKTKNVCLLIKYKSFKAFEISFRICIKDAKTQYNPTHVIKFTFMCIYGHRVRIKY